MRQMPLALLGALVLAALSGCTAPASPPSTPDQARVDEPLPARVVDEELAFLASIAQDPPETRIRVHGDGYIHDIGVVPLKRPFPTDRTVQALPELEASLLRQRFVKIAKDRPYWARRAYLEIGGGVEFFEVASVLVTAGQTGHNYWVLSGIDAHLPEGGSVVIGSGLEEPDVHVMVTRHGLWVEWEDHQDRGLRFDGHLGWGFDRGRLHQLLVESAGQSGGSKRLRVTSAADVPWMALAAVLGAARYRLELPAEANDHDYEREQYRLLAADRSPLFSHFQLGVLP